MDYKVFAARMVDLFQGYAAKYPKSEWVQNVLFSYSALTVNCWGLTITEEEASIIIKSNKDFWVVLRDNPELTTEQMRAGDYKIPAEWR